MMQIQLKKRTGLYVLYLKRLYELQQKIQVNYIPLSTAAEKICRNFSIDKHAFLETLMFLSEFGFIQMSSGHGFKLLYEIKDDEVITNKECPLVI